MSRQLFKVMLVAGTMGTALSLSAMAGVRDVYWHPTELTNTIVWLDASDTNTLWADIGGATPATTSVARWDDKSGNSNHLLQAGSSAQPITGSRNINGLNAVDFDGSNHSMQEASNAFGSVISNATVFMVAWFDTIDKDFMYLDTPSTFKFTPRFGQWLSLTVKGSANWGDGWMEWSNPVTNLVDTVSMNHFHYSVSEDVFKAYLDCVQQTFNGGATQRTANGTVATTAGIQLPNFDGLFGEVIILNETVTTDERQLVEGYLLIE